MIIIRKDQLKLVEPTDPILHKTPEPFDFDKDGESAEMLANVLFEKMKQYGGAGLSANQVGLDLRVFVMGLDNTKICVFNPEILEYSAEEDHFNEGCLSYPGIMLNIKRPFKIRVRYHNEKNELIETDVTGLTARIFQHEFDHMNGTDFTTRVSKLKLDFAKKKFSNKKKKIIKKYATKTMIEAINDHTNT